MDKLLVFCKLNTADAESLCARVRTAVNKLPKEKRFECLVAHSKMSKAEQNRVLERLSAEGVRAALFNCRLFQEGVEVPGLNGVLFAAPRHSPRDIIQSICRPLNKLAGKPISTIFLPVTLEKTDVQPEGEDLERFADILPVFDALAHEDNRLYEYLMGNTHKCTKECGTPCNKAYPIDIIGTHSLGLKTAAQKKKLLLAARKATRYTPKGAKRTFMQPKNIPWAFGYGTIKNIVETHNRFAVTGEVVVMGEEKVNIYTYLKWCADEYLKWKDGKKTALEPYQIHQLEELPKWSVFGVHGPYPPHLCLEYLEEYMDEHDGEVPMINLSHRECVAIDATKIERLCGFSRIMNMNDMSIACRVNKEIAAKLDAIFAKYGLDWRKKRRADGTVDTGEPSLFQQANQKLNHYHRDFKRGLNDGTYIRENFTHGQYD